MLQRALRTVRGSAALRHGAAALGWAYMTLVDRTTRWIIENPEARRRIIGGEGRYIAPLWHGRLFFVAPERPKHLNAVAMISANRDGDIIATCIRYFGVPSVRGSTHDPRKRDRDKKGQEALAEALEWFARSRDVVVVLTPDGPRGPRMRAQAGVARLAIDAGVPVIPMAFSARRARILSSWDSFMLPTPFNLGAKVYGDPLPPPENPGPAEIEEYRARIEAALNAATRRADELVGRTPVEPAPPRPAA